MSALRVVRAAAGCGKTTDLAARYLRGLRDGVPAAEAIAITFTRRAAAELEERVALALRACLPDGDAARARLGRVWDEVYAAVAPSDPAVAAAALEALPEAPIGTTDTFVQRLLSEFALDAALPVPEGPAVPLDLPIAAGTGPHRALERAARRVLDPPDGALDPDVALLCTAFTLDELVPMLARRGSHDRLPLADTGAVLAPFARAVGEELWKLDPAALFGVSDPASRDAWVAALAAHTTASGQWAVPAVAAWAAAGARPEATPLPIFGWAVGLDRRKGAGRRFGDALQARSTGPLGPGELDLFALVNALRYPYDDPEMVARADALRGALDRLRARTLARGLREAALAGELGHDELLAAAVHLVEQPAAGLRGRFRTLLVDEAQDANPGQLRLYRALAALGVDTTFVGDSRQSVYLFRDAEPEVLRALEATADPGADLRTNRRSHRALVEAHRALFDALDAPMRRERWRPLASLATLAADPGNDDLAPADGPPVTIVVPTKGRRPRDPELDRLALAAFLERLDAIGRPGDTAVVLTPSWGIADEAARTIRALRGRADAAFVEGATGRRGASRVSDDLRGFLGALLSDDDDLSWLLVWKHPCVGLTDAALARATARRGLLRRAGGRLEPWREGGRVAVSRILAVDALGEPHDPIDREAFARARPALLAARRALGRTGTATVLDRLFDALGWRTVLAAGPGGDEDLAELDVLLDFVRERDARAVPADAVLAELGDELVERPVVRLVRPAGTIACTTLFQAKGLAWDHVCVLRIGHPVTFQDPGVRQGWMAPPGAPEVRLEGLKFDPHGGLSPFKDPVARLAARLHALRQVEECARFAYVAITRARRTVTFALPSEPGKRDAREAPQLRDLLPKAWSGELAGVARVARAPVEVAAPRATGWARVTDAPDPPREPLRAWDERAPSSLAAHLSVEERARLAENVAGRVRLGGGFFRGGPPRDPPADPRWAAISAAEWGTLAHGWFARWGFRGPPDEGAVGAYLAEEWRGDDAALRGWLLAVSRGMAGGPLWALVSDPTSRLRFELPLIGAARAAGRPVVLSGRMDLLVERPRGRVVVIDFKAGGRAPASPDDLVGAGLRTYAAQLEAYAEALEALGHPVERLALWYVRTNTQLTWR